MGHLEDEYDDGIIIDTICQGCDLFRPVNDLSLCDECFAKLERDLIRSRDWAYSATAFNLAEDQLEALRERVIRDYGAAYELIADPNALKKRKGKPKRSHSRNTQRKRAIMEKAIREYDTDDVLQAARDFLQAQSDEWVNYSRVSQHLYETFYQLKPKRLGQPGRKYKSLLKLLADHSTDFELRQDDEKKGVYWIRLC
ncbi:MAG: hypothetical protein H6672_08605 [Anaerolineaceae bacterium]|nr:hypothetical protein [Anaerolineaceae bacterium]